MLKKLTLVLSFSFISIAFALQPPVEIYETNFCQKNPTLISPYFSNIYASHLIVYKNTSTVVKDYAIWYIRNLNYPDIFGLSGTIYDFSVSKEHLIPTYSYDSADAYAGTFLTLVYFYTTYTGDYSLFKDNLQNLKDIAYLMLTLRDHKDGLVKALPNKDVKYLVDNLETYIGLVLFVNLLKTFSDIDWKYYDIHAKELYREIRKHFFSNGTLYWAIEGDIKYPVTEEKVYPDMVAKFFWMVFNGKELEQKIDFLSCEQRISIDVFKRAVESIRVDKDK